jgi:cobaltochelatase CobS
MAMPKSRWIHNVELKNGYLLVQVSDLATDPVYRWQTCGLHELTAKELQRCYRNLGLSTERHWTRDDLLEGLLVHFGMAKPPVAVPAAPVVADPEPTPTPSVSVSAANVPTPSGFDLGSLGSILEQVARAAAESALADFQPSAAVDEQIVRDIVAEGIAAATIPQTVTVISPKVPQGVTIQGCHRDFTKVVKIVQMGLQPWLHGEAGTGKTTLSMQIAESLGLPFYGKSLTAQTTESSFYGYQTADGSLIRKAFREAWENGGVFLLDEVSSAHSNLISGINMALANGVCEFPDGMIPKHEDFRVIAAANDIGMGPTAKYPKGIRQDASFRDRFVFVEITLDESVVEAGVRSRIQGADADRWLSVWSVARSNARQDGSLDVTPRSAFQGADLISLGFSLRDAAEAAILRGADGSVATKILADTGL